MHFKSVIAAVMVVCAGVLVVAQGKVATPEELDKTMKALGQANQAAGKAITSGDFAEGTKAVAVRNPVIRAIGAMFVDQPPA